MQAQPQYARLNAYHGPKRKLLGIQAAHAPPAWRGNAAAGKRPAVPPPPEKGSKILLSQLPVDVGENEVEVRYFACLQGAVAPTRARRSSSQRPWAP